MKTGKRLLALVLVLAMLLSNLPVGALAAEFEELAAQPAEALTETEQPTEAAPVESEAPETTAAPTEAPTEAVTETPAQEAAEAAAEEVTEPAQVPTEGEELTVTEEAVMETTAEEENLPYLTFAPVYENENGLYADTNQCARNFVNPYGQSNRVAFFLNEYDGSDWTMTSVQVEAVDDSISLELVEVAITGADCYYYVTTNVVNVTSGVSYEDVTMDIGTWPHHFHFSTEASNSVDTESLIYELDADHLGENDSIDVYAVMFHEDFTWSDVHLSEYCQQFASLYQVSDSIYRISISGNARNYVMDNGYVYLDVLGTQTEVASGSAWESYMSLPIFLAPNPGLVMVGVGDEGYEDGFHEDGNNVNFQFRICPGQRWHTLFYLRQWDYSRGELVSTPVDPDLLQTDGDLTFTVIDPAKIREGEENGEYFVYMTTNTFDQDHKEVYILLDDGTKAGGVYYYTQRGSVAYYDSEVMSNDTFLGEYYVNSGGDSVLYLGIDETDTDWTRTGEPYMMYGEGSIEGTDSGMFRITVDQNVVDQVLHGNFQWLDMAFDVTYDDGGSGVISSGIWLIAHEEDFISYLTYGWLEGSEEGLFEGEWHGNTGYSIVPGDAYPHIYYVHTWDAEQGCYVESPVPADELYCDDDNFTIAAMPVEDYRDGEANADCFVWVAASEWDHESEIYTTVDGVRSSGVYVSTYLPQLGFYSEEEMRYDTYLHGAFYVNPEAEENAFYVGLYAEYWVISGDPWLQQEDHNNLMSLEKINDNVIKVTLTQEAIDAVLGGEELWPCVVFDIQNTEDENWTDTMYAGGLRVLANSEDIIPADEGFRFRFLEDHGKGFFDPHYDNCFGTNLAKGDVYSMYFFLNIWDEDQDQYVEIPVHPQYPDGIVMEKIENVREGEEHADYYYAVSVTEFDTEHEIWVEYEGETYTMPIFSYLHEFAAYSSEEPSHDTRILAPVETDPFGENVVYFAYLNDEWTVTDMYVVDWCSEYADIEQVTDNVWELTLNEAGIDQNMSQWHLGIAVGADIQNNNDPNWYEYRETGVTFSRENLQIHASFSMESGDYKVIDGGYIREWFTGEYGSDEWGSSWEIWDAEVLTDLPDGLSYDWTTNTFTMDGYSGERMIFNYGWTDDEGNFWAQLPSDTLTIELIGDNELVTENYHALDAYGGLNVVITGDGSLLLKTVNNFGQDHEGNARTFNTVHMNGGYLTIQDNASVTVEIAGQGNESCWGENGKIGERAGNMTALAMDHGQLYVKDNARLETVIPEGAQRNGSVDVGEDNAIWGERFPGGYRGIADTFLLKVMGGTLVTQSLEFGSGYHDDGTFWSNNYAQTGGDVIIQATGWNNILEEDGVTQHTHCEGFTVRGGGSAGIWGGSLTVNVEATDAQLASSTYYEGIAVCGGELEIGGDAEVTIEANHEGGNLLGVSCEWGENGPVSVGKLNITGGTLNVNGTSGEGNGRCGIYMGHETRFTMSGGTVNLEYADFINHGPAHITGGTINIGGLYWYETMIDDRGIPYAWVTGFNAGGPEFTIDGGTINVDGGHFVAGGMVAMNGGEINIINGSLQVNTAFALNDGVVNISNPGSDISEYNGEPAHIWPALWVNTYFSIGGSDIENAAPTLNITDHQIPAMAVRVDGTYHQMAGSTVNLTYTGTEKPGIYVATQFNEDGSPVTDINEEGEEYVVCGSFLMNDGVLNVMNPGDADAELIRAMESDPHAFVQFRGGETNFDTAQLFWNGETHITENAVVEVKDTAIIANAGHLVMDDGTLLANEESAVCLGMSEMNGGRMELDNAMILVNGGFHFNNGEIVINNTDEAINTEAVFTSLAANTYFAIGNPEDPNSNPKLTINHNLTRCPAVLVNGTMHLMAGTVELNVPVTKAPAISVSAPIFDENDDPIKVDDQGNPLGGEFLQNGGVLNISSADGENIAGVIAQEGSVFFMNGGEANLNGTNLVMSGQMFLYDKAVLNITDGILRLYETASLDVNAGQLNMDSNVMYSDDIFAVLQAEAGSTILLQNNGVLTIDNEAYRTALELYGELMLESDAQLNIRTNGPAQEYDENGEWIWRFGVYANETSKITVNGGAVNVEATDINGAFVTWGEFTQTGGIVNLSNIDRSGTYEGENAIETNGPTVISGGTMNLVSTDTGYANNSVEELENGSRVTISGGTINIEVPRLAMFLCSSTTISDGNINIQLSNYYNDAIDENGDVLGLVRYTQGIFLYGWDNPGAVLNITGGDINIVIDEPEREYDYVNVNSIFVLEGSANITEGLIRVEGGPVFFHSTDAADYLNLGDMAVYSRNSGTHLEQLYYTEELDDGTICYASSFEEDNVPDDMSGFEDGTLVNDLVIVTNKAGTNTTWEVNDGVLTFQSTENIGGMYDYSVDAPAPWYWLHDFITIVEMDTHLGYIGNYAFNGLNKLTKLVFLGEAPNFAENAFAVIDTDAFYPVETDSWTTEKLQDYGGNIAWLLNYQSVEVIDILTDKDVLFSGEKTTLTAQLYPDLEDAPDVVWTLAEGDSDYATLTVKNNVATVTAKTVTEKQVITLYAVAEEGLAQPVDRTLTIYPQAKAVSVYSGEEDVTGTTLKVDLVRTGELTLTAAINPNDAEEYLAPAVTWTSSNTKVATVENGFVTFTGTAGTAKITATATDGSKKKAVVTITALEMIQGIEMAEGSVEELLGGKSASFTAVNTETKAKLKASQITWSMDDIYAPYASITTAGKLTTKVVQEAVQVTIVGKVVDNEEYAYVTHVVTIRPITSLIQLEKNGMNVTGDTLYVDIDGYDADNLPCIDLDAMVFPDGAFENVTWKTSSKAIATVDEDGVVTGVWNSKTSTCKTGTVTITATSADGSKKSASVNLNFGIFAQDVEITSLEKEIVSGSSLTLTAEVFPENTTKTGVTWKLQNAADSAYLSVTAAGKVKAKTVYAPTDVVLVATSKDGCESAEMTLTVLPKDESILVIKSGEDYVTKTTQTLDLNKDPSITLSACTLESGAAEEVTWTPATSKLGTIVKNDDGTLTVTMTKAGSMTVTAKASDGRKATVTLKAVKLSTGVTVEEKKTGTTRGLTLAAGKTMTLKATLENAGKAAVIWSVEPSNIATITSAGKLTASAGLAYAQPVTVTATANDGSGAYGELEILLQPQVQGIQIHGLSGEVTNCTVVHDMNEDAVVQLSAQTYPADAAEGVTWKSSSAKVATIDEKGQITCVKPGTVTITATATDGSGKKATFKLTVVKKVTELVMAKTAAVAGGKSLTLSVDAGDATDGSVTWSMTGDTAYATLSGKGVLKTTAVTAPKTVRVTATAKDGSGKQATCVVTICPATTSVQILCDGEVVTGDTIKLQVGQSLTLEGSSLPVSAADLYTWKSSAAAVAEVDAETGEITCRKAGTATITCTAADGSGKKATVKIKVVSPE